MPTLWKRATISQIVADRKWRAVRSMRLVQTGSPTSLIDLFIQNRDQFRKNKSRKNSGKKSRRLDPVDLVNDRITPSSHQGLSGLELLSSGETETEIKIPVLKHDHVACVVVPEVTRGRCRCSVLLVVALAMCCTKLAIGITLLAFLLLILEGFVGKRWCWRLGKRGLDSELGFGDLARRIWCKVLALRRRGVNVECLIEVVSCGGGELDEGVSVMSLSEKDEKVEEGDCRNELSDSGCEKSKVRKKFDVEKMGAKLIKKLVSKKSRKNIKHQYENVAEAKAEVERREECSSDEEEVSENSSTLSVNSINKCDKQEAERISLIVDEKGTETGRSFGNLVMFSIALAGLIGGRFLALMLTISWCFMLKAIKSWSRSGNVAFSQFTCRDLEPLE